MFLTKWRPIHYSFNRHNSFYDILCPDFCEHGHNSMAVLSDVFHLFSFKGDNILKLPKQGYLAVKDPSLLRKCCIFIYKYSTLPLPLSNLILTHLIFSSLFVYMDCSISNTIGLFCCCTKVAWSKLWTWIDESSGLRSKYYQ